MTGDQMAGQAVQELTAEQMRINIALGEYHKDVDDFNAMVAASSKHGLSRSHTEPCPWTMRLTNLLEKHQEILPPTLFIPHMPVCGDRLIQIEEYGLAADVCFSYCLKCIQAARSDTELEPPLGAEAVEAEARCRIGIMYCRVRLTQLGDPAGHNRATVNSMVGLLHSILAQAKQLAASEQYAWIILNATILVYQVAMDILQWKFHAEAAGLFREIIDSMEASETLQLAKYLSWRLQVYSALAFCHEESRDPDALLALTTDALALWDKEDPAKRPTPSQQRHQANYLGDQLRPLVDRAKGFRMIRFKCTAFPLEPEPDPDAEREPPGTV